MSGFRSSEAKERTHAELDLPSLRSRWVSGLSLYQSVRLAIGVSLVGRFEGVGFRIGLVELALRTAHRRRPVVAQQELDVLAEDLAQVGGHDDGGDGAE